MPHHEETHYAGLGVRFGALVIDALLFCAVFFPITRIVEGVWIMSAADHRWTNGLFIGRMINVRTDPLCLIFLALMLLYFVPLEGLVEATLGNVKPLPTRSLGRPGRGFCASEI